MAFGTDVTAALFCLVCAQEAALRIRRMTQRGHAVPGKTSSTARRSPLVRIVGDA